MRLEITLESDGNLYDYFCGIRITEDGSEAISEERMRTVCRLCRRRREVQQRGYCAACAAESAE